jgi:peptidoglycan/xylan/chitin deacetylase (PgdA/CDA1 family)
MRVGFVKDRVKKYLSGLGYYRLRRHLKRSGSRKLLILMYHDLENGFAENTTASLLRSKPDKAQFEAHLKAVRASGEITTVEEAVDSIEKTGVLQEDSIAITFDDGYGSVYDIAYPLLRKYDIPATVYLTTGWIDGEFIPWWEDLADMITGLDFAKHSIRDICEVTGLPAERLNPAFRSDLEKKTRIHETLASHFRELPDRDVDQQMAELASMLRFERPDNQPRPLNWDQIREMSENGIRFGSHTRTHPNLRDCDASELERELLESRNEIEHKIEKPVTGFAYPYGQDIESYATAEPIMSRNGFSYACTAVPGNNDGESNLYLLLRETLPQTTSGTILDREISLDFSR